MYLPKYIYYVAVKPGGTALEYRQRGGKIFTTETHANNHRDHLISRGVNAEVYATRAEWEVLDA